MLQNNTTFYLKGTLSESTLVGGTFNISNDKELGLPIDTNGETVSIVFRNDRQIERMTVTISNGVATIVARGIEQRGGASNAGLQKQWNEGVLGYITALDFDMMDIDGVSNEISANNTFTGDNNFKKVTFNNTTEAGLEVNSLTTTERLAITAVNGAIVYDETLGDFYIYKGGAWAVIDTGTSIPNMSETVNGTAQISTASQRATGESTGSTGARLVLSNDALTKTPNATPANDENKIPVLNDEGKIDNFVSGIDTYTEQTDVNNGDQIALSRAGQNSKVDYEVVFRSIFNNSNYIPGSTYTYAEANTERTSPFSSYSKAKEITIVNNGNYTVSFDLKASANDTGAGFARVYINGEAAGIQRFTNSKTYITYSENFELTYLDKVQLYFQSNQGTANTDAVVRNFNVKYDIGIATPIIDQD